MSLKEKAKTEYDIYRMVEDNPGKPHYALWVPLEDAEQALLDCLTPLEQEVRILQKERLELKQKLQLLLNTFPDINNEKYKLPDAWTVRDIADANTLFIKDVFEWKKKFEELLKEKEAKTT